MWSLKKTTVVWGAVIGIGMGFLYFNVAFAAPNINIFTADKAVIPANSSTTLNWSVTDATSCTASGEWSGNKSLIGSEKTANLAAGAKKFTLSCVDADGKVSIADVNIVVASPPTLSFSASDELIEYNTSTNLSWSSTNANYCEKYGDWSGNTTTSGTEASGNLISEKSFGVRCVGDGGEVERLIVISISNPTLQVELVFKADKYFINYEEKTTLRWSATNADFCTASGSWSGSKDKTGGLYDTPALTSNKTYSLYCSNSEGSSVLRNVTVVVAPKVVLPVTVDATTNNLNIEYNTPAKISWTSENASYCRVYYGSWTGNLPVKSSYTSSNLLFDKTFTVRCYNSIGVADDTVTIKVGPNPAPAPSLDFSSKDSGIAYNTSTNLGWNVADTNTLEASGDWSGFKAMPSGNESTGNLVEDKKYSLIATGDGGFVNETVNVNVGDPTVPPTVNISSDLGIVPYNNGTVVRWKSEDADWCKLSYRGLSESVGADGNRYTADLIADVTYKLECGNEAGSTSTSVTINVVPIGFPPIIKISPDLNPVDYGRSTILKWTTTDATSCVLSGVGSVATNGSIDTGSLYLPKDYNMTCVGDGGKSSNNVTIDVIGIPSDPPMVDLQADKYSFYGNGSTTLRWTTNNADSCWASRGPWSGDKALSSGEEVTTNLTSTTLFEITCENVRGTVSDSVVITVDAVSDVELIFYPDNTEIELNSYINLTWNGKNANWCESYSYDNFSNWGKYQNQVAGMESTVTIGPITKYNTPLLLRCWNYTSNTNWKVVYINAGDHPPSITMSAPSMVAYNSPATISWFADYADSCLAWASPAEPTWTGSRAVSGLQLTSNLKTATYFYLRCANSEGTETTVSKRVTVGSSSGIAPQTNFTSDKYIVNEGEEYTLKWNVSNATWCSASANPINGPWSGAKSSSSGSQTLTFSGDQNELVLTCGNAYGSMSAIVRINKGGTELAVPSISFWADEMALPVGGKTMLRWYVENAESCVASNGWSGTKAAGGGQELTTSLATTTRFELNCSNTAGIRTAFVDVVIGGSPPGVVIFFNASRYDVSAGSSTTLSWSASNASYCYAIDPNGVFIGGKTTVGSDTLSPTVSTTYKMVCGNSGGEVTATVPIIVAKVIVCPSPARIINTGNTIQLTARFKLNADIGFSCSNIVGSWDITNGHDGFTTDWSSLNDSVVTISSSGLATGLQFTELTGGPVPVSAVYKEAKGETKVTVSPPPISCWKCSETRTCFSEITFPISGKCPSDAYDSMYECAKSCRKPVDWQEIDS